MTLDLLCKVVDNFGDIGVVYRLARALAEADPSLLLRLHVDDLRAFRALCPEVEPERAVQRLGAWTILRWDLDLAELETACAPGGPPRFLVECFACGRPPALEELVFASTSFETLIVNLEHLTAETWAEELHRLPSATRSPRVRKVIFMPGFGPGTGGLLIDGVFRGAAEAWAAARAPGPGGIGAGSSTSFATLSWDAAFGLPSPVLAARRRDLAGRAGLALAPGDELRPWIPLFSYERDYRRIVADLAAAFPAGATGAAPADTAAAPSSSPSAAAEPTGPEPALKAAAAEPSTSLVTPEGPAGGPLLLLAAGRSAAPFLSAWEAAGRPFPLLELPFLPQELWDEVLLASDFAIVRGEESLARAALAGIPFLWHAYRQEENYQLVKVRALLARLRPTLAAAGASEKAIAAYEELSLSFNDRLADSPEAGGEEELLPLLAALPELRPGFAALGRELFAIGDLASHLLAFIREMR